MTSLVVKESETVMQDVAITGLNRNSEIVLATALLAAGSPLQRTKVIEVELEYEADAAQTVLIEYTNDGGATWATYSSFNVTATTGPQVLSRRRTLTHHNLQLRLRSTILGALRVIGFYPRLVAGEKVNP